MDGLGRVMPHSKTDTERKKEVRTAVCMRGEGGAGEWGGIELLALPL